MRSVIGLAGLLWVGIAQAQEPMTQVTLEKEFGLLANKYLQATNRLRKEGYENDAKKCSAMHIIVHQGLEQARILDYERFKTLRESKLKTLSDDLARYKQEFANKCEGISS